MKTDFEPLRLSLKDTQWPLTHTDHDRQIARAIVFDEEGCFYFMRADRNDIFGKAFVIETSGGGIEPGETPEAAIRRELLEEMGAQVEIVAKIGVVDDYYNLVHRHNINHYFLCRALSFGKTDMTEDEIERFHLSTLKMTAEEAEKEYIACADSRLGTLIRERELPVLRKALEILA